MRTVTLMSFWVVLQCYFVSFAAETAVLGYTATFMCAHLPQAPVLHPPHPPTGNTPLLPAGITPPPPTVAPPSLTFGNTLSPPAGGAHANSDVAQGPSPQLNPVATPAANAAAAAAPTAASMFS